MLMRVGECLALIWKSMCLALWVLAVHDVQCQEQKNKSKILICLTPTVRVVV